MKSTLQKAGTGFGKTISVRRTIALLLNQVAAFFIAGAAVDRYKNRGGFIGEQSWALLPAIPVAGLRR